MKGFFFIIMTTLLSAAAQSQMIDRNALPEDQVKAILSSNITFPDTLYEDFTHAELEKLSSVNGMVDTDNMDYNLLNAIIFFLTNKYRAEKKIQPLQFLPSLRDAAVFHSLEMVNRNFYDHINTKNRKFRTPIDRIDYFGFKGESAAENITYDFVRDGMSYWELGKSIVKSWIDSSSHRKNMLDRSYKYLGTGSMIKQEKKGVLPKIYATQNFGS